MGDQMYHSASKSLLLTLLQVRCHLLCPKLCHRGSDSPSCCTPVSITMLIL